MGKGTDRQRHRQKKERNISKTGRRQEVLTGDGVLGEGVTSAMAASGDDGSCAEKDIVVETPSSKDTCVVKRKGQ